MLLRRNTLAAAKPPADMMPGSPFGPGIVSLVTYLHACQMVSYNRMIEVLDGLFGLKLSEGAIANMLARAEKPFAAHASEIAETVRTSPVIASDETSARVCGKTHWQWTFVATSAVYHTIAPTRGKAVPTAFLGDDHAVAEMAAVGLHWLKAQRPLAAVVGRLDIAARQEHEQLVVSVGDLPQGDQRLSIGLGRKGLRRYLLHR